MASCQSTRWVSTSPYIKLTVTQSSSTDTTATLSWTLQYISDYPPSTSSARPYTVTIAGSQVKSGSFDINGKTGTHTIASGTKTINKTTSAQTIAFSFTFDFSITWSGNYKGTVSANSTISVAAKTKYTVSYNANGGSGAPSSQTKWHGTNLTLSSTKPTRTGHSFLGWSTSSAATSATYIAGATYSANASTTLYAVWKANTYSVKYNANGGSGAPGTQTKTYGKTLVLSSTIPTRTNYNFLGWGTSASATTVAYAAGANYTKNSAITLYAIWELAYVKPRISNISVSRYDSETLVESDTATSVLVKFDFACDQTIYGTTVEWYSDTGGSGILEDCYTTTDDRNGSVNYVVQDFIFSTDSTYTFTITAADASDYTTEIVTLPGLKFPIDIKAEGKGIAFGKPAELENVADIGFQTRMLGGILHPVLEPETDLNDITTPNIYIGANLTNYNYTCGGEDLPLSTGTFSLEVIGMGEDGQVKQRLTYCHKTASRAWERIYHKTGDIMSWGEWICVSDFDGHLLWDGGLFMHDTQEINLAEPVSKQRSGIVLVFCRYSSGTIQNYHFSYHFVPKMMVAMHEGCGSIFQMGAVEGDYFAAKYLYISDQTIKGNSYNDDVITDAPNGIKYTNNATVLRYVIGV